jgi:hypothetical protein
VTLLIQIVTTGHGADRNGMPGWIFVSMLLATATLLAIVASRPLGLILALAVITLVAAVAGALVRPDRQASEPGEKPPR